MKLHSQTISQELLHSTPRAKALFAFLCAERLRGCCWAYQAIKGISLKAFFHEIEDLFELLLRQNVPNVAALEARIKQLEAIMPTGEDSLSVQAQSGVICLVTGLDVLADGKRTGMEDAINAMVDALDNYEFFMRTKLKSDARNSTDYPLLAREIVRQLADAKFVKTYKPPANAALMDYRIENLQYAVPPAVWDTEQKDS